MQDRKLLSPGRILLALGISAMVLVMTQQVQRQRVGRQTDGSVPLETSQRVKPAGRQVEFISRPNTVVLSPDKRTAAVLNGYGKAIVQIDPEVGVVKQVFEAADGSASYVGLQGCPSPEIGCPSRGLPPISGPAYDIVRDLWFEAMRKNGSCSSRSRPKLAKPKLS